MRLTRHFNFRGLRVVEYINSSQYNYFMLTLAWVRYPENQTIINDEHNHYIRVEHVIGKYDPIHTVIKIMRDKVKKEFIRYWKLEEETPDYSKTEIDNLLSS